MCVRVKDRGLRSTVNFQEQQQEHEERESDEMSDCKKWGTLQKGKQEKGAEFLLRSGGGGGGYGDGCATHLPIRRLDAGQEVVVHV